MESKFTNDYAEKLAKDISNVEDIYSIGSFKKGYMKAIEETNASELLEALIEANNLLKKRCLDTDVEFLELNLETAINKATK